MCTFEDGNTCGLRQEVGDSTDWWLVSATFVQQETEISSFKDHTMESDEGYTAFSLDVKASLLMQDISVILCKLLVKVFFQSF